MLPPICQICGKDFRSRYMSIKRGGEFVTFADYAPVEGDMVGDPSGAFWVCDEHLEEAKKRQALKSADARAELHMLYGIKPDSRQKDCGPIPDPQLWILHAGRNPSRTIAIIKEAKNLSSQQAQLYTRSIENPVVQAPLAQLEPVKARLDEAGAVAGIVFNDQKMPPSASTISVTPASVKAEKLDKAAKAKSFSLPLTLIILIVIAALIVGFKFGAWWALLILGAYVPIAFFSIIKRSRK